MSDTTVLIGKNNEGKSDLLRALEVSMTLLQIHAREDRVHLRRRYLADETGYQWVRDFPVLLQERRSGRQTIFKLEFFLDEEEVDQFKESIGSNLNGTLPLEIKIGPDNHADIQLKKPGKNTKTLSNKSSKIADFVAQRIYFNYIPAVRTDKQAMEVISRMVSQELRVLERDDKYLEAIETIQELQKPVLENIAENLKTPLQQFLPAIDDVKIEVSDNARRFGSRRDFSVVIDDGTPTNLEYKCDGVKSLVALGILKNRTIQKGASIIAIEEPESHLHPGAIHQLNGIINSLSETAQVIVTTHNPLFVDRYDVKSNIIIDQGRAVPAKEIKAIRDLLGVKASDNLVNAGLVLVLEGDSDEKVLRALLPKLSARISKAIRDHVLVFDPLGGSGKLTYKLSVLENALCKTHVLLDDDTAGKGSYAKAESDSLLKIKDCTFTKCPGMADAEMEDCLDKEAYKTEFLEEFGVSLDSAEFKGNARWSDRMKATFAAQGKIWTQNIEKQVKTLVADTVSAKGPSTLCEHKRGFVDALVIALEEKLRTK